MRVFRAIQNALIANSPGKKDFPCSILTKALALASSSSHLKFDKREILVTSVMGMVRNLATLEDSRVNLHEVSR